MGIADKTFRMLLAKIVKIGGRRERKRNSVRGGGTLQG